MKAQLASPEIIRTQQASWRDYYQLTKPRVVALLLLTALVGSCLAVPELPPATLLLSSLTGIGLLAASAAAINHVIDRHIDRQMARTYNRPLPKGRLSSGRALAFAAVLGVSGFALLWLAVNPLTAWLTLASLVGYAGIYTGFLKRATPQNIVIGGLAGAMPPLLGWTAVTGDIHPHALLLVMIIFTWTPPHFWALAIARRQDYARVNIPMLPVTHGVELTKSLIFGYTLLLALVCLLPYLTAMAGGLYLVGSTLLNLGFLYHAWRLKFGQHQGQAMATFRYSIVHLMVLFVVLLADHYLG